MPEAKTPCIGICSTTSLGDPVCRGCKRYAAEVIDWNSYDERAKLAVLTRIEKLNTQILSAKFRIFSVPNLKLGLEQFKIPYDPALSPYCWLHNLLKKGHSRIDSLEEFGVYVQPQFASLSMAQLSAMVEEEILTLSEAHHQRYIGVPEVGSTG